MTKLISMLLAAAALAVPSAALAHHSKDGTTNHPLRRGLFALGTGTATSGTFKSPRLGSGTYTAAIAASATAKTGKNGHASCAPASGTVTLTSTGSTAASVTATVQGRLCSPTKTGAKVKSLFLGKLTVTSATGAAAPASGGKGFTGLVTRADGTSRLVVAVGPKGLLQALRHRLHR